MLMHAARFIILRDFTEVNILSETTAASTARFLPVEVDTVRDIQ